MSENADMIRQRFNREVSPFGEQVLGLLDSLYAGLHHVPARSLEQADWGSNDWIRVTVWDDRFSTFDSDWLTRLVVLAHDRCIRVEMQAAAYHHFWLCFTPRVREGNLMHRHPTIEQAIEQIRQVGR